MDIEVVEAIESLRTDIGRVETSLRAEIGKLRAEMATKSDVTNLRAETRNELATVREELKRHTDMRFESLRDDIRMVAEGFAALSAKFDRLRPPLS
jgi:hypothetical protein